VKLHRLPASTAFEAKVKTNCKENPTPIVNFKTQTPQNECYAVRNMTVEHTDEHNATIHWDAVPDALSYTFFYKNVLEDNWIAITTKDKNTGVRLHDLPENTRFECKVHNQKEDVDIISLYLNTDKIVDSLLLKNHKKEYIIDLTEKQNLLTLFAHTTGTEGPNTAAILIEDGYTAQTFILNATLGQSEAMWINK
jgi:hypothetical protein